MKIHGPTMLPRPRLWFLHTTSVNLHSENGYAAVVGLLASRFVEQHLG